MLKEQYNFKISTNNIGPLQSLNFNDNFDATNGNKKIAIYAKNGSGKTMISKSFSLCNKNEVELCSYNTTKLITKGQQMANFSFKLSPSSQANKTLNISLIKNGQTTINNNTDYIFHIFNSEYVKENIETNKYAPNDKIDGYIVGKINIDLSQDENNLKILKEELDKKLQDIKEIYLKNIKELDLLKIDKKTKEYKDFTFESIFQPVESISNNYSDLLAQYNSLKSLPDNLPDIQELAFQIQEEIFNTFDFLNTKYIKSQIAKDIREDITNNFEFISLGINKFTSNNSICPFCKTNIDKYSQQIINNYIGFLDEKESKMIAKAKEYQKYLSLQINNIENFKRDYKEVRSSFESLKKYLPSQKGNYFDDINNLDNTVQILAEIVEKLKFKIDNISLEIDISEKKELLAKNLQLIINTVEKINKKILKINQVKNKIGEERLLLNRKLCEAKKQDTIQSLRQNIANYKDTEQKYKVLKNAIEDKKSKIKKDKKSEVAKDIKKYLEYFFGKKYTFDETKFAIMFKDYIINGEMEDVLSDGEKSIIALCYYLASIHLLVEKESDYSKICYIIDDPISSMDFSYVFCVSRLIDTFCKSDNTNKNPVIVLTHNLEFMNILIKNQIIDLKYILSQSHISTLSKELISPYEHHLIDIINISKNGTAPTHTTANSLRYLIESIWKFIKPDLQNVEEFILQEELFKNNEYIITIINDFSHGTIRQEISYTDEQIKNACDCLVSYIDKNFPGQIKLIKNQL